MPNNKNIPYFHELSLDKMLESHDWTYQYSDDHRYWRKGSDERNIIHNKIKELGGFNKEIVKKWNKFAPKGEQTDMEWQEMIKKL